jgi:hypothetical protein
MDVCGIRKEMPSEQQVIQTYHHWSIQKNRDDIVTSVKESDEEKPTEKPTKFLDPDWIYGLDCSARLKDSKLDEDSDDSSDWTCDCTAGCVKESKPDEESEEESTDSDSNIYIPDHRTTLLLKLSEKLKKIGEQLEELSEKLVLYTLNPQL